MSAILRSVLRSYNCVCLYQFLSLFSSKLNQFRGSGINALVEKLDGWCYKLWKFTIIMETVFEGKNEPPEIQAQYILSCQ